jgi:hypothetical protein
LSLRFTGTQLNESSLRSAQVVDVDLEVHLHVRAGPDRSTPAVEFAKEDEQAVDAAQSR